MARSYPRAADPPGVRQPGGMRRPRSLVPSSGERDSPQIRLAGSVRAVCRGRSPHPGGQRQPAEQELQAPARAVPHVQGTGPAPVPHAAPSTCSRRSTTSASRSPPGSSSGSSAATAAARARCSKCLAGIYDSDRGALDVHGRLAPFIELGVGFNPDLTARDNAIINAIMLGLTRKQAQARFDDIVEFAELEEFMDLQAEELLLGDARPARLLGGDPGRRRHPADRRGARGRRRLLPAEVLRPVHQAQGGRPHDRVRHPRHGRRSSTSATARC